MCNCIIMLENLNQTQTINLRETMQSRNQREEIFRQLEMQKIKILASVSLVVL